VAGDVRHSAYDRAPLSIVYLPIRQAVYPGQPDWRLRRGFVVGRAANQTDRIESALATIVRAVDPAVVPVRVNTLRDRLAGTLGQANLYSLVVGVFAALALGLASLGVF